MGPLTAALVGQLTGGSERGLSKSAYHGILRPLTVRKGNCSSKRSGRRFPGNGVYNQLALCRGSIQGLAGGIPRGVNPARIRRRPGGVTRPQTAPLSLLLQRPIITPIVHITVSAEPHAPQGPRTHTRRLRLSVILESHPANSPPQPALHAPCPWATAEAPLSRR